MSEKVISQELTTENLTIEKSWNDFQKTGLFWLLNTFLHVFGWCLIYEREAGDIKRVYPARTKFRGFSENCQDAGHRMVAQYLAANAEELKKETEYTEPYV